MTAPGDLTPPPFAAFGAGLFPVQVLIVWKPEDGWHLVTVLYRDRDNPPAFLPPWSEPFLDDNAAKSWQYLARRLRDGQGGNFYTYELEGFEVAGVADIRAVVEARAAQVAAATLGPFGEIAGTLIMDAPSETLELGIPFALLSDDRWAASLVATAHLGADDVSVHTHAGARIAAVPYQSAEHWQRNGTPSWPLEPGTPHLVAWDTHVVRLVVRDDATFAEIVPIDLHNPDEATPDNSAPTQSSTGTDDAKTDKAHHFLIQRVPQPRWVHNKTTDNTEALYDALGEETPWAFALPWMYRALASPLTYEPVLQAPAAGDDLWDGALAYWSCLLHLLVYGFGWARPDRGLRWWYDAGKPTDNDPRLQLISQIWDADGQLDWFAAWLWSTPLISQEQLLSDATGYHHDGIPLPTDERWIQAKRSEAQASGFPNPCSSGLDPLHVLGHTEGALHRPSGSALLVRTGRTERRAILLLDSMKGWYRALATETTTLPDLQNRSWHVYVVVRPVGCLGGYRRSRTTGLWFASRHRTHMQGV